MPVRASLLTVLATVAAIAALPAAALPAQQLDRLVEALALDEVTEVMREEGVAYGAELGAELFDGDETGWAAQVARIYDADAMRDALAQGLAEGLVDQPIGPILEFFEEGPGARLARLEASARRAMLDPHVEADAERMAARAMHDETARFALIDGFVEANDLIEANVAGALNSSFAFSQGLLDGGAFGGAVDEAALLGDVWAQEPQIRRDTTEWLYAFLNLAYGPAPAEDLQAYIAFSEEPAGRALNRALFSAYDEMLIGISRELGLSAARLMAGQRI
ncbi:hypothetical protein [Limimaricola cinnabarinus]|jgi:hypothetical protein|uniref:DUF2059 domain-containing protein n=1 Tax=Limimaricola cinnabarinus TaxID=1125964 RepID=A0A2G1MKA9_9RHOB|nr:hypothetical protein [Limimaricola cinnabarinus]PHP29144.1 hypothetical protein CJ301_01270 [Limimaricola cinnabarinus]